MPNYQKHIVYLSDEQRQELFTNGSITVNGQTVTYSDNDMYVTPQEEPVTDVQINGTSVTNNGVANVPVATTSSVGVVGVGAGLSLDSNNRMQVDYATVGYTKLGSDARRPVVPYTQDSAAFYGLAKAAGADMASSSNAVGTYTPEAKTAIQNMLDVPSKSYVDNAVSNIETMDIYVCTNSEYNSETGVPTVQNPDEKTFYLVPGGDSPNLYIEWVYLNNNWEQFGSATIDLSNYVQKTDYATSAAVGVVKIGAGLETTANGALYTYRARSNQIKAGAAENDIISPYNQHEATFYGLAKVAGADEKNSTLSVGTYTDNAKSAIRTMLGAASTNIVAVQDEQPTSTDTKVWLPGTQATGIQVPTMEDMENYVQKTDYATNTTAGIVFTEETAGLGITATGKLFVSMAAENLIKAGSSQMRPIVPVNQHQAVFYGLAKAAGDTTQSASDNAVGTYTADASAAIRSMLGAISNTDYATSSVGGTVKINSGNYGISIDSTGLIKVVSTDVGIKNGANINVPVVAANEHIATFYGLAKAAGDTTQSASSNTVGTYTTEAKSAIQQMLGIDLQSIASEVEIPLVETVSGTTPSITGQPNTRYVCGEVSTLSITPPSAGSIDVIFDSGSTPAVITVPNTVRWPAWFDATALEADTTYEILITDGVYGSVMTWAN